MLNNDVMRSVRYIMDISDPKIVEIIKLANFDIDIKSVISFLKKEDEDGYEVCSDIILAHFLDGLIILKRGKDREAPPLELPVTNNLVLKKLRVAFSLKEDDLLEILKSQDFKISKSELSGLLRKKGHINYRECGDQILRNFLKGLTKRVRG
ncbi:MAG: DUF1456 family protein [Bacteriovoracales bacterium]